MLPEAHPNTWSLHAANQCPTPTPKSSQCVEDHQKEGWNPPTYGWSAGRRMHDNGWQVPQQQWQAPQPQWSAPQVQEWQPPKVEVKVSAVVPMMTDALPAPSSPPTIDDR